MKAQAEAAVERAREQRLEDERDAILAARRSEAKKTWKDFQNTYQLPKFSPGANDVLAAPAFDAIIDRPLHDAITKADFDAVQDTLPDFIEAWRLCKKSSCSKFSAGPIKIPPYSTSPPPASSVPMRTLRSFRDPFTISMIG